MNELDITISDLNDISEILDNNGYGGWCKTLDKALELLKDQKNLIDVLIEDQLKKDEEQQAEIDRLKAELNQYHKADTFLAVHGWQWKDDGTEHHTEQLKDGEQE